MSSSKLLLTFHKAQTQGTQLKASDLRKILPLFRFVPTFPLAVTADRHSPTFCADTSSAGRQGADHCKDSASN